MKIDNINEKDEISDISDSFMYENKDTSSEEIDELSNTNSFDSTMVFNTDSTNIIKDDSDNEIKFAEPKIEKTDFEGFTTLSDKEVKKVEDKNIEITEKKETNINEESIKSDINFNFMQEMEKNLKENKNKRLGNNN